MDIFKYRFLIQYYISNLVRSKIGRIMVRRNLKIYSPQWASIKSSFSEKKNWLVIANGPSLKVQDIEKFSHIPAIASNKINLLYGSTNWRPTLYTIADPLLLHKLPTEQFNDVDLTILPHTVFFMARTNKRLPFRLVSLREGQNFLTTHSQLPDPISSGFIDARTITTLNIQMAMWLGAKTVYLLGCDHSYSEKRHQDVKKLRHGEESNHFHPGYRQKGEIVNNAPLQYMERGYDLIRKLADKHGTRIVNISRETHLESFERDSLENALKQIEI